MFYNIILFHKDCNNIDLNCPFCPTNNHSKLECSLSINLKDGITDEEINSIKSILNNQKHMEYESLENKIKYIENFLVLNPNYLSS